MQKKRKKLLYFWGNLNEKQIHQGVEKCFGLNF